MRYLRYRDSLDFVACKRFGQIPSQLEIGSIRTINKIDQTCPVPSFNLHPVLVDVLLFLTQRNLKINS